MSGEHGEFKVMLFKDGKYVPKNSKPYALNN